MSRLAAFAYRDGDIRPVEFLDQHLFEVAINTYLQLAKHRYAVRFLGVVAGLLHDVGKALNVYQMCKLVDKDKNGRIVCLYTAHEVFSSLIVGNIVDVGSIPDEVVEDLMDLLRCSYDQARKAVPKLLATVAVLHHQAMGDPFERLKRFASKVLRELRDLEIDRSIIDVLRSLIYRVGDVFKDLRVDFDEKGLDRVEEQLRLYASMNHYEFVDKVRDAVVGITRVKDIDVVRYGLLAKLITGTVIASDIYVANRNRGEARKRIHLYLEKMFEYLTQHRRSYAAP